MKKLVIAGILALLGVVLVAQGPLTPIGQLNGRTDSNGYLLTSFGTYAAPDTPLTPIGNLRGRTDSNGYLITTPGGAGNLPLANGSCYTWAAADSALCRDAPDQVGLRDGTTGQYFRIYNTWSAAGANQEALGLAWSGNAAFIQTEQTGTGTARNLNIRTVSTAPLSLGTNSIARWTIDASVGYLTSAGTTFAALGTPGNGAYIYCSDCTVTTAATCPVTQASCVCAGSGSGAFARRVNGAWYCTF